MANKNGTVTLRSFDRNWTAGTSEGAGIKITETQVNRLSLVSPALLRAALKRKPISPEAKLAGTPGTTAAEQEEIKAYLSSLDPANGDEVGAILAAPNSSSDRIKELAIYDDFFKPEPKASATETKTPKADPKIQKIYLSSVTPQNSRVLLERAQELFAKEFLTLAKPDRGLLSDNDIARIQNCAKVIFALVYLDHTQYRDHVRQGVVSQVQSGTKAKLSTHDLGSFTTTVELVRTNFADNADMHQTVNDMCVKNPDINNLLQRMTGVAIVHVDTQSEYKFFLDFMKAGPVDLRSAFNTLYVAKDDSSAVEEAEAEGSGTGTKKAAAKKSSPAKKAAKASETTSTSPAKKAATKKTTKKE